MLSKREKIMGTRREIRDIHREEKLEENKCNREKESELDRKLVKIPNQIYYAMNNALSFCSFSLTFSL